MRKKAASGRFPPGPYETNSLRAEAVPVRYNGSVGWVEPVRNGGNILPAAMEAIARCRVSNIVSQFLSIFGPKSERGVTMIATVTRWTAAACLAAGLLAADRAAGNAGRFRLFYPPHGDPAARGVLARLDPTLQPARETLLRVVKEDLSIGFQFHDISTPAPITDVEATYTIENPTDKKLDVDFGFPILRGIVAGKDGALRVNVRVPNSGVSEVKFDIITNSVIYGLIRQRAGRRLIRESRPTRCLPALSPPCGRPSSDPNRSTISPARRCDLTSLIGRSGTHATPR